jgi:hypothetical protein
MEDQRIRLANAALTARRRDWVTTGFPWLLRCRGGDGQPAAACLSRLAA